ncbi:hypothetical protein ILYODFUR_039210 [Ilyodon furcidens]|uniref:Uncharacterized protein n=1 Tax=Ilyodon furcidens TaxID=33524 RepID=A0ABV0TET6_9TELE
MIFTPDIFSVSTQLRFITSCLPSPLCVFEPDILLLLRKFNSGCLKRKSIQTHLTVASYSVGADGDKSVQYCRTPATAYLCSYRCCSISYVLFQHVSTTIIVMTGRGKFLFLLMMSCESKTGIHVHGSPLEGDTVSM